MSLFVERIGQSGNAIVLLHGWGFNGEIWTSVATTLAQNYRVYVVDLAGYGYSVNESADSLEMMAKQVISVVPEDAHWVGWSLGGLVAVQAALQSDTRIASLTLVTSNMCFTKKENWQHGVDEEIFNGFAVSLQKNTTQTLKRFLILQTLGIPDAKDRALQMLEKIKNRPETKLDVLSQGLYWLKKTDFRQAVKKLNIPVFICLGQRDTLVPVSVKEWWHEWLPEQNISIIPGAGHAPFITHQDNFLKAFNFFMSEQI